MEVTYIGYLRSIEGLEGLRALAGPRGKFRKPLFGFMLPEDGWGRVDVITRRDGHYLELQLTNPEQLPYVEQKLGLKFLDEDQAIVQGN